MNKDIIKNDNKKTWITTRIRISGEKKKKGLYLLTDSNDDTKLRQYYKFYCGIINKVIMEDNITFMRNEF
jgi:hypothetical protein